MQLRVRTADRTTSKAVTVGLCLIVCALALNAGHAVAGSKLSASQIRWLDRVFSDYSNDTPGVAVAVARDADVIYRRGFGIANLEYDIPIKPDSVFHAASIAKQFTAMAVVLLEQKGMLSMDDDVRKYIPEVPDFGETITIRHLANHTSGLRDQWELLLLAGGRRQDLAAQEDVLDIVSRQRDLNFRPGEEYIYSNTGYTLLAVVVERVSGRSLREYTERHIFKPLGMGSTHFHDDMGEIVKNRACGYESHSNGGLRISTPNFETYGATSLFSTALDLSRWSRNFFHLRVGGEKGVERLLTRGRLNSGKEIDYALGVVHGSYRGLPTIGHGGSDMGYKANLLVFPEQRVSISVLANVDSVNPADLSKRVANVVLNDEFAERSAPEQSKKDGRPKRVELAPGKLREYTGCFCSEELSVEYEIRFRLDKLYVERRRHQPEEILPIGADAFIWSTGRSSRRIEYMRTDTGRIDGLRISSDRVRNLRFVKKERCNGFSHMCQP